MHQSLKFIFRLILALIIFTVTLALLLTCYSKFNTLAQANMWLEHRQQIELVSSNQQSYLLLSNSQKPDRAIFIVLKGKGYISKISCEHYQARSVFLAMIKVHIERFKKQFYKLLALINIFSL
jgi:hypothetical protein